MLSGNGRHRRPRQAPALIVAAGVTGSAIAIPLLGAASANAADGTTWDRVAECESGGQWSADDGNGYYGGLQLTQENWQRYGGRMYAPSADEASRSQQIAIAEKVLADQGLAAWPTCGPLSGLSKNSGEVSVDTGVADDSSSSSDSSTSSDGSGSLGDSLGIGASSSDSSRSDSSSTDSSSTDSSSDGTGNSTKSDTPSDEESGSARETDSAGARSAKGGESGNSGQDGDASTASEGSTTGAGRHRGGSAAENSTDATADDRGDDSSGRHASRDSGAARGVVDGSYVVRTGDSLSTIADTLDLEGGWTGLYAANAKTVGVDPDLILPGQSLAVDAESGEK
ncbi:transglycosylase family protein [Streptomyces sp. NBC_01176]|uniref:LysM peptidoglycan-binding domain-containing protein n=1 Tax=Streptomyces sp. NBC_01176 TaxID=2903760 RepID=UPI0038650744|nr:transglycosylase family protein [Streptomyces sp. NBC_01176]